MDLKTKKTILEIYGLSRMILGVAQIVGLTAGFFLMEWIIRYPPQHISILFDEDTIVLVYLAVFLRGMFHIVAGIGMARLTGWARGWLIYGWPIIILMVIGLAYILAESWVKSGATKGYLEAIAWTKTIVYMGVIGFDYVFVGRALNEMAGGFVSEKETLESKKIGMVFFAALLFFVLVLYLGKPVKQGFYQGYYRLKNEKVIDNEILQQKKPGKNTIKDIPLMMTKIPLKTASNIMIENKGEEEVAQEEKEILPPEPTAPLPAHPNVPRDMPYRELLGFLGGIGVIVGIFAQFMHIFQSGSLRGISLIAYFLLSLGFFFLMLYAMSFKLTPLIFTSFFALSLTIAISVIKWNQRDRSE